jgi:uncharacterized protein YbaR (Trm112 family)
VTREKQFLSRHGLRFTVHGFILVTDYGSREGYEELPITADFIETFRVVCPACKGKVVLKEDASGIKCTECRRVYPVRNDIPALIVEEATVEDEEPRKTD